MATTYKQGDRGTVVRQIQKIVGAYPDGIWGSVTTECVKRWQKAHGIAAANGLAGPKTLAMMGITAAAQAVTPAKEAKTIRHGDIVLKKSRRRIDDIVIHCTATPEGQERTVKQIRAQHIAQGWSDIGYHYVVTLDGTVHIGRDVDIAGSHAGGHNSNSIGVVYVGGLENKPIPYNKLKAKDTRTDAQKAALMSLLIDLKKLYPLARILGHRDYPGVHKDCPSFNASQEYKNI